MNTSRVDINDYLFATSISFIYWNFHALVDSSLSTLKHEKPFVIKHAYITIRLDLIQKYTSCSDLSQTWVDTGPTYNLDFIPEIMGAKSWSISMKERKRMVRARLALSVLLWTIMFSLPVVLSLLWLYMTLLAADLQNNNYPQLILPNSKSMHLLLLFTLHLQFWSFTMSFSFRSKYTAKPHEHHKSNVIAPSSSLCFLNWFCESHRYAS